ncbi:hypothetical protein AMAG_19170 [Allomyces macrogynus ATCC 38327]|uniref:Uncharacterized protein n=1 Tax=Allomyces macrogynus (strain ATCC 38327) TaxID=578462 RepID=A0A0L0SPT7_ALLM3|nr:hypothetical protein AMAG_19170 [Allomyces macrogynus ATCC 38327]|eukprot:KNE64492.1 hypothetical protein AMAG_19170 [Allomyces macrogynus ATCC 38327]
MADAPTLIAATFPAPAPALAPPHGPINATPPPPPPSPIALHGAAVDRYGAAACTVESTQSSTAPWTATCTVTLPSAALWVQCTLDLVHVPQEPHSGAVVDGDDKTPGSHASSAEAHACARPRSARSPPRRPVSWIEVSHTPRIMGSLEELEDADASPSFDTTPAAVPPIAIPARAHVAPAWSPLPGGTSSPRTPFPGTAAPLSRPVSAARRRADTFSGSRSPQLPARPSALADPLGNVTVRFTNRDDGEDRVLVTRVPAAEVMAEATLTNTYSVLGCGTDLVVSVGATCAVRIAGFKVAGFVPASVPDARWILTLVNAVTHLENVDQAAASEACVLAAAASLRALKLRQYEDLMAKASRLLVPSPAVPAAKQRSIFHWHMAFTLAANGRATCAVPHIYRGAAMWDNVDPDAEPDSPSTGSLSRALATHLETAVDVATTMLASGIDTYVLAALDGLTAVLDSCLHAPDLDAASVVGAGIRACASAPAGLVRDRARAWLDHLGRAAKSWSPTVARDVLARCIAPVLLDAVDMPAEVVLVVHRLAFQLLAQNPDAEVDARLVAAVVDGMALLAVR